MSVAVLLLRHAAIIPGQWLPSSGLQPRYYHGASMLENTFFLIFSPHSSVCLMMHDRIWMYVFSPRGLFLKSEFVGIQDELVTCWWRRAIHI